MRTMVNATNPWVNELAALGAGRLRECCSGSGRPLARARERWAERAWPGTTEHGTLASDLLGHGL
jgi:hypothetical protein